MTLHARGLPHPKADAPLPLFLHGARRSIAGSTFRMRNARELAFAMPAVDHRGFGQSTAELLPEDSVPEDACAACDWTARAHPGRQRFMFGHSLPNSARRGTAGPCASCSAWAPDPGVVQSRPWPPSS